MRPRENLNIHVSFCNNFHSSVFSFVSLINFLNCKETLWTPCTQFCDAQQNFHCLSEKLTRLSFGDSVLSNKIKTVVHVFAIAVTSRQKFSFESGSRCRRLRSRGEVLSLLISVRRCWRPGEQFNEPNRYKHRRSPRTRPTDNPSPGDYSCSRDPSVADFR